MKIPALMAVTAAALLTLSACGSSSSTTASPAAGGANSASPAAAAGWHTVWLLRDPSVPPVNPRHRVVRNFEAITP